MTSERERAMADFKRMIGWILLVAVLMSAAALIYLATTGEMTPQMVLATIGGVFFSVLLGCGLFAASFFSSKSGHDESVGEATRRKDGDEGR